MQNAILDQETWKFINTFAPWLSAIVTIAAVIVSLYLARRSESVKLNITAGHRLMATPGIKGPYPEYLAINIVNTGHRDVQITNIGWRVGFFKKQMQYAIQVIEPVGLSSPLPIWLRYGEQANYYIPLGVKRDWLEGFTRDFYKHHHKSRMKHTKIMVSTSLGNTIESTIEKGLQNIILEYIESKLSIEQTESVHTN
jgi:hypothetical protein